MTDKNNSLDILKERYVNGEITKEQFDEMKANLESVYKSKKKMSNKKKIGITIGILFFILVIIGAVTPKTTVPQNTSQPAVNANPLSLMASYSKDMGNYTSNGCDTSNSLTCITIVNALKQDCSNPSSDSYGCSMLNSTLTIRQSYFNLYPVSTVNTLTNSLNLTGQNWQDMLPNQTWLIRNL